MTQEKRIYKLLNEIYMKPEIENLKMWMSGRSTTGYQRALAVREFEQLLTYVAELEQLRQPLDRLPNAEDVKRWYQMLVGKREEAMQKDIQATLR